MGFFNLYHQKPLIGVKGRVQSRTIEKEDKKESVMEIICEKITFLSSHSKEEKKEAAE